MSICTSPIVSTVTILPDGDPVCVTCNMEIVSAEYTNCGTLRVVVTANVGSVDLSLDGAPYITITGNFHEYYNVPIGHHQIALRKGTCTDIWSGSVYCQERRCFRPGSYECVTTGDGELTGYVNATTLIEHDCITEIPTGRIFYNNGSEMAIIPVEKDTDRCSDTRCLEYELTVSFATAQSEIVYTDCDTDDQVTLRNIETGDVKVLCSSSLPIILKNGSIATRTLGYCESGTNPTGNCCDYLVVANGSIRTSVFGNIRYTDCDTGQIEYEQIRQGTSTEIRSATEPVLISSQGGSVELVGECQPQTPPSVALPTFTRTVFQPTCIGQIISPGTISLSNILNATRYKICNGPTYNCVDDCAVSSGTISGATATIQIPTSGGLVPENVTIRVYNGSDCLSFTDTSAVFFNPNCIPDTSPPEEPADFSFTVQQAICNGTTVSSASVLLTNITNAARYSIVNGPVFSSPLNCTESDGLISGSTQIITIPTVNGQIPSNVSIRVYRNSGCVSYRDINISLMQPDCQPVLVEPTFTHSVNQPFCAGTVLSSATLLLSNIQNGTRYRICNSATFNCGGDCAVSSGTISGSAASISIPTIGGVMPPNVTVRVYNGPGCTSFRDVSISLYGQNCATPEIVLISTDFLVNHLNASCNQPSTYDITYNMYARLITPVIPQSGKDAYIGGGVTRSVPNGLEPPDAYIMAGIKASCGSFLPSQPPGGTLIGATFYRFIANLNKIYADFPATTEVVFEVWGERTNGVGPAANSIQVFRSTFTGVRTVKVLSANGSIDFSRDPLYNGQGISEYITYNSAVSGFRKLYTYRINRATQVLTVTSP